MRIDMVKGFNAHTDNYARHIEDAIKVYRSELERLERALIFVRSLRPDEAAEAPRLATDEKGNPVRPNLRMAMDRVDQEMGEAS